MKKINVDPEDLEPIETDGINLLYIGTFLYCQRAKLDFNSGK